MSADKYPCIFSSQMEAVVYILANISVYFFFQIIKSASMLVLIQGASCTLCRK